jgi:hypothetical protein
VETTPEQQAAVLTALGQEGRRTANRQSRPFFPWLKELTLTGYYTSEIGASQELRYLHVSGYYDGDVPYEQVGRAYS